MCGQRGTGGTVQLAVGRGRRRDPLPNGGGSQVASTPCQILNDNANAVHLSQLDAPQI